MGNQRFRLQINVFVQQLQEYSPGNWQVQGSTGLEVRESFDLNAAGFMELAGILGRFHELKERIEAERHG